MLCSRILSNSLICVSVHYCVRIDPGNASRLVVNVSKYVVDGEYWQVEMSPQEHELWLDRTVQFSLSKFHDEIASKIIWGPS